MVPVREYGSPAENIAHAKALRDKVWDTAAQDMRARAAERARLEAEDVARRRAEIAREQIEPAWSRALEQAILDAVHVRNQAVASRLFGASYAGRNSKQIIASIAADHGFSYDDLVGIARNTRVVRARYIAIRAVREAHPEKSLPWLGKVFNRDHTTILHALRRCAGMKPEDFRPRAKYSRAPSYQPQEQAA